MTNELTENTKRPYMDANATYYKQYLQHLLDYSDILEQALYEHLKEFHEWVEKEASKLPEEDREGFYQYFGEDEWVISEIFPNILNSSLFLMCYSFLEAELVRLCKLLCQQKGLSPSYDEFHEKGNDLQKTHQYLKKVAGLSFPDNTPEWQEINDWTRLRNVLVHNEGKLDSSKRSDQVRNYITRTTSLDVDHSGHIRFSVSFYVHVIVTLNQLLDSIYK